jgi:hypothetical protein
MTTAEKFKKELETTAQFMAVEKRALKACEEKVITGPTETYTFKDGSILKVKWGGRKIEAIVNTPGAATCKTCGQLDLEVGPHYFSEDCDMKSPADWECHDCREEDKQHKLAADKARKERCYVCSGFGEIDSDEEREETEECWNCEGTGKESA